MTRSSPSEIQADSGMVIIGLIGDGLSGFVVGVLITLLIWWGF